MIRVKIAAGLVAVAIGTAWWAGALPAAGMALLTMAPYLLIGTAVVGGVRALAPRGTLIGPAVMLVAGIVWLLVRNKVVAGRDLDAALPVMLVLGGFYVALSDKGRRWKPDVVRRYVSFLWRRDVDIAGIAPAKLVVTALLGTVTVDLGQAAPPAPQVIEIDLTVVGGRVVLELPIGWKVVPGRIHERGVHLDGTLDCTESVISADDVSDDARPAVVINVLGLLGAVALPVRPASG